MKNQKEEGSFYAAKVCMSPGIRIEGGDTMFWTHTVE